MPVPVPSPSPSESPSATPDPTPGKVRVSVRTWADVFADGIAQGRAPVTIKLPPGPHTIRVANDDHAETIPVNVESDKTITLGLDF